jgi:CRP/FNR family cyclic AMP-dependent transcriptional regulator
MRRQKDYLQHFSQVPMFQACSQRELAAIARAGSLTDIPDGKVLCQEGERGDEFFVILEGTATVSRSGRKVTVLGPGDFFGELALLDTNMRRDATVVADGPLQVFVVGRREFTVLLEEVPALAVKLLRGMARRLHDVDSRTITPSPPTRAAR